MKLRQQSIVMLMSTALLGTYAVRVVGNMGKASKSFESAFLIYGQTGISKPRPTPPPVSSPKPLPSPVPSRPPSRVVSQNHRHVEGPSDSTVRQTIENILFGIAVCGLAVAILSRARWESGFLRLRPRSVPHDPRAVPVPLWRSIANLLPPI